MLRGWGAKETAQVTFTSVFMGSHSSHAHLVSHSKLSTNVNEKSLHSLYERTIKANGKNREQRALVLAVLTGQLPGRERTFELQLPPPMSSQLPLSQGAHFSSFLIVLHLGKQKQPSFSVRTKSHTYINICIYIIRHVKHKCTYSRRF